MSQVRITTDNVRQVASQMASWSSSMRAIASNMNSSVNNIKDWNDARAEQFRQQASMTARQLMLHIDNFTKMADFLIKYASMQEDAEHAQNARMKNI